MSTAIIPQGLFILGIVVTAWAVLTCRQETRRITASLLTSGTSAMFVGSCIAYGMDDWLTILTGIAAALCAIGFFAELRKAWRRTGGTR